MTMTPRTRVMKVLQHKQPDRIPKSAEFTPGMFKKFNEYVGASYSDSFLHTDSIQSGFTTNFLEDKRIITFESFFNIEFRHVELKLPKTANDFTPYHEKLPENARIDEWGVARIPSNLAHYTTMKSPLGNLNNLQELKNFPWPGPVQKSIYDHIDYLTKQWQKKQYAVVAYMQMTIFELAWFMRGFEQLFIDMLNNSNLVSYLLDRITEIRIEMARCYANAGVDILRLGDDLGTQRGLLMSKQLWSKWIKPRLKEIIDAARKIKPDIHIFYHTDGKIEPVIPDLIEIGIDILNPVQPECMDVYELYKEYGKDLSFWGTIGTQTTMPFGSPKEIKRIVHERIKKIGQYGGLVLAPTHKLQTDVPWENIKAFFDTINEYKNS